MIYTIVANVIVRGEGELVLFVTVNSYQQNNFRLIKKLFKVHTNSKSVSKNFAPTHPIHPFFQQFSKHVLKWAFKYHM